MPFLESVFQDIHFALRSFAKTPTFTATVLLTLALGIGVGTAVFSIVNAVLLEPLPYRDPGQLLVLRGSDQGVTELNVISSADFLDLSQTIAALENAVAFTWSSEFPTIGDWEEKVSGVSVTEQFFELLGVEPIVGRRFSADECERANSDVVILQYDTWRTRFGSDPEIVGKKFNSWTPKTIVGVMPPGFVFYRRDVEYFSHCLLGTTLHGSKTASS